VSNPAKPWNLYIKWMDRIMEEFYTQGDRERELNLPIGDGYDKLHKRPAADFQLGFINFIVRPVFGALDALERSSLGECMGHLSDNVARWERAKEDGSDN
jgi:hypothetical protein